MIRTRRGQDFWQNRLQEATNKLDVSGQLVRELERLLRLIRLKLKHKSLSESRRQEFLALKRKSLTKLARARRVVEQLSTTKIPYYRSMLERKPRTLWDRLHKEIPLNVSASSFEPR